ncbi:MAG: tripartite tricarboxylate transporter substrate binding protein [Burkholderiales bacterium]|nr:tripartite tricarboxylate transporter substrate binding protein [Burkholderiales bacterium]
MQNRRLGATILFAIVSFFLQAAAWAYPARPVRLVALNPPGGVSDTIARAIGERLAERWGQGVVVDNRVGASGIIGSEIVARAQPDGHTLLLGFIGNLAINPGLYKKLPYDPIEDFAPISLAGRSPMVVVVNPSLPARSIKELIALARAQPGKIAYSSSGSGNGNHLATELFATMAGIKLLHVPYKGGPPALTATIQGETAMMFANSTFAVAQVKTNRVRAIAVTTDKRLELLPDVPTVAESGLPDFVVTTWFGVLAPAGTPKALIARINADIVEALGSAGVRQKLDRAGLIASPSTPEEFGALIKSEIVRWGKVIRDTGAKAD